MFFDFIVLCHREWLWEYVETSSILKIICFSFGLHSEDSLCLLVLFLFSFRP